MDLFLRNYMDLFPRTSGAADIKIDVSSQVETIVLLSNRILREKEHLKFEIDMEEYRKVKGEHKHE